MNSLKPINIITVPAFHDNYLWLFHRTENSEAWVVDPGDSQRILAALEEHKLTLSGILITHHHPDHTGGIDDLLAKFPNIPVYGPDGGSVPQVTHGLKDGDSLKLNTLNHSSSPLNPGALNPSAANNNNEIEFRIFALPGHTLDHIAYLHESSEAAPVLFCGDTLFAGGCGRLFEGSAEQMHHSLNKLKECTDDTRVYCAHEYTLANLAFALAVEPDNETLIQRIVAAKKTREENRPTIPTTVGMEKATNPFMRSEIASIKNAAEKHSGQQLGQPSDVFAAIRQWKDNF